MSIYVVFIGGYRSSKVNVVSWKDSAENQRDDVKVDAYPYPDIPGYGADDAVNGFKQFDDAVQKIEDSGADQIFIVGHSSGCAIANKINSLVKRDHKIITLVDLDGFAPTHDQIKKSAVQAWSAEGDGGRAHSLNWAQGKKMYPSAQATEPWSLHFSLVNTAATDAITRKNYKDTGYAGCIANLAFLPKKN